MAITTETETALKDCEKGIKDAKTKEDIIALLNTHTSALGYKKICRMLLGKATAAALIEKENG